MGGHAGLMTLVGGLQEPHLQHHASSTQRFHAGQGMGGVPEPFPSPPRRPQRSGEWGSQEAAPLGAEPRCFVTGNWNQKSRSWSEPMRRKPHLCIAHASWRGDIIHSHASWKMALNLEIWDPWDGYHAVLLERVCVGSPNLTVPLSP